MLVDAVVNAGPREDSTRIGSAGTVRRQAVDVSPMRRVNMALCLLTTGARESAFRSIKTIAECLADELINASKGSSNSYAIKVGSDAAAGALVPARHRLRGAQRAGRPGQPAVGGRGGRREPRAVVVRVYQQGRAPFLYFSARRNTDGANNLAAHTGRRQPRHRFLETGCRRRCCRSSRHPCHWCLVAEPVAVWRLD